MPRRPVSTRATVRSLPLVQYTADSLKSPLPWRRFAKLEMPAPTSAKLRTTCVATRLDGGHADNALPQRATALVNCRMLPDDPPDSVMAVLQRVVGDKVKVIRTREIVPSPPSPLRADVVGVMTALSRTFFGGAPVVPEMSTGATDGLFTRNAGVPTYGVSALAFEQTEPSRAHGRDERIGVAAFHTSVAFWEQLVQRLAGPATVLP